MDDYILYNLATIAVLFITLYFGYIFRTRIRPIALVHNQMDMVEQFQENLVRQQPLNTINVTSHPNPFHIILLSSQSSSKDGIRFKVQLNSSEQFDESRPIHLVVAWAVQIDKFYSEIEHDCKQSLYAIGLDSPRFLTSIALQVEHEILTDLTNQNEFFYKIPEGECAELFASLDSQNSVRNHYHVVVALFKDAADLTSLSGNDIIANINVYHLKDSKMDSKHIQNFVKFKNNLVANINRIFVDDENLCVVCQTNAAVQVLLPCSHKCVCSECIHRLNRKCPMCRSPITNKFEVS